MKKKPRPIILNVGAPEWMATYSDMMSLLLCFFILIKLVRTRTGESKMGMAVDQPRNDDRTAGIESPDLASAILCGQLRLRADPANRVGLPNDRSLLNRTQLSGVSTLRADRQCLDVFQAVHHRSATSS